jgi:hypothetical protein
MGSKLDLGLGFQKKREKTTLFRQLTGTFDQNPGKFTLKTKKPTQI